MHRPALATQLSVEPPVPLVDRAALVLQDLRKRVRRATAEEVEVRSRLLVGQLQRLARLTTLELARCGAPEPVTFRTEIDALERRPEEAPESKVELLACRIACAELSRRSTRRGRRRGGRAVAAASLKDLRLDARMLFEWAKADLWSSIARRAVAEASRTASSVKLEGPAVAPRLLPDAGPLPGPPDPRRRAGAGGRGPRDQRAEPSADPAQDGCRSNRRQEAAGRADSPSTSRRSRPGPGPPRVRPLIAAQVTPELRASVWSNS